MGYAQNQNSPNLISWLQGGAVVEVSSVSSHRWPQPPATLFRRLHPRKSAPRLHSSICSLCLAILPHASKRGCASRTVRQTRDCAWQAVQQRRLACGDERGPKTGNGGQPKGNRHAGGSQELNRRSGRHTRIPEKHYVRRAASAQVLPFGKAKEEAISPTIEKDDDGQPLDGTKSSYSLRFAADQFPAVNAFWSLTVYDLPTRQPTPASAVEIWERCIRLLKPTTTEIPAPL